jgi:L-malate glycosyltransferase
LSDAGSSIRIGFVLHVMQVAGAEMLVAETIRRLGRRLDPVVLCLDGIGQLGERMRAEGVPVVALGRRPGVDLAVGRRLAAEIRARSLDVVHAHQYTPFFYSAVAKLFARRRYHLMFTEHGRHFPDDVSPRRRWANRWLLSRFAGEVNAVCEFSAAALRERDGFGHRHVEVIENGIDPARYGPPADRAEARRRVRLRADRRHLLCVARFHPVKDHRMLLEAFALAARGLPDVDLVLAGDGALRGDLEAQVQALGVGERVRFLGVRDDVPDLLRAADLFTLTSISEAASLTLLEAMASSVPVVVTNVGGNPEIVRDGVEGRLVPRGDAHTAAGAFTELLGNPERARHMGEAGRRRVEEHYQLDRTVARYYERYRAAVARTGTPVSYAATS